MSVLGLNISFKAEADQSRIEQARQLLEERYSRLDFAGKNISKEKLLIFLALGLADDLLQSEQTVTDFEQRLSDLLARVEIASNLIERPNNA